MRIFLDDNESILRQLRKLYYELPFDLRSEKTLIPASELIVETIEFIACLKIEADFHANSGEENNNKKQRNEQVLALKTFKQPPPILPKPMPAPPPPPPPSTTTAPRPFYSNLNINVRPQSVLQRAQFPTGLSQVRMPQKTFTMMPPRGHAQTVSVQLPNQSNPIMIQANGGLISIPSYTRPNYPLANNSVIRMPRTSVGNLITGRGTQPLSASIKETSMLKKSLTLITKDSFGKETPIRIVNANFGESPASFNIARGSDQIISLDLATSKSLAENPKPTNQVAKNAPAQTSSEHGLICPDGCMCPHMQDRAAMTEKFKEKLMKYMSGRLKILSRDSETCLTYNWIQDGIFEKLLATCKRKEFFKFCRVVGPNYDDRSDQAEKDSCIILEKTSWDDQTKRGCIRVNGKLFSLPLLIVKLFREGFGEFPLINLTLYSRPDCALSRGTVHRTTSLCINPFHYVTETTKDRVPANHQCSLRLRADVNGVKVVCVLCQTVYVYKPSNDKALTTASLTTIVTTGGVATVSQPQLSLLKSSLDGKALKQIEDVGTSTNSSLDVTIKAEQNDDEIGMEELEDPSASAFNEMEDEFEGMLRSFEASVEEEEKQSKAPASKSPVSKSPPSKPKSPETQARSQMNDVDDVCFPLLAPKQEMHEVEDELLSQESNNTNNRIHLEVQNIGQTTIQDSSRLVATKRTLELADLDNDNETRTSVDSDKKGKRRKSLLNNFGNRFQCWKCLEWQESKDTLANHACLPRLSFSDFLYVCHYCGFCSATLDPVRHHVSNKCKKFGLSPLTILKNFRMVTDHIGDHTKSDVGQSDSSSSDLQSSSRSKRHKKSDGSKCEECDVTFASNTELVLHMEKIKCKSIQCDVCNQFFANARTHQSHNCSFSEKRKVIVDQDIVVIKSDKEKISQQPVKCQECGNLIQSYDVLKYHQSVPTGCSACKTMFNSSCKLLAHECTMTGAVKGQRQTRVEEKETRQNPLQANQQQQHSREGRMEHHKQQQQEQRPSSSSEDEQQLSGSKAIAGQTITPTRTSTRIKTPSMRTRSPQLLSTDDEATPLSRRRGRPSKYA